MDRHERWILEAAVRLRPPLRALFGADVEAFFNVPHHGLGATALAEVLRALLRRGFITLEDGQEEDLQALAEGARPLGAAYYGLTAAGGAAWEQLAEPDWSRFLDDSYGTDPDEGEVTCADPARLDWFVFSPYQDHRPIPASLRRDRREPWSATYWKTLPLGHRLRFSYEFQPISTSVAAHSWLRDARDWFTPAVGSTGGG